MRVRTVIVDDEPLARSRIARLLAHRPEIQISGECCNGAEAVATLRRTRPDLVLLDVQMPDKSGFDVLAELEPDRRPVVVFATAYDAYALRAFEVHAIDYLLKPFDRERFDEAIDRALKQVRMRRSSDFHRKLVGLLADYRQDPAEPFTAFRVERAGRVTTVLVDDVFWVSAEGNYVGLHLERGRILLRATLSELERRLAPAGFVRIHRSILVHRDRIAEVAYLRNGEFRFTLRNGRELRSGRSYRDAIDRLLDDGEAPLNSR